MEWPSHFFLKWIQDSADCARVEVFCILVTRIFTTSVGMLVDKVQDIYHRSWCFWNIKIVWNYTENLV